MIYVNCPTQQEHIKGILAGCSDIKYTFVQKKGIKLEFSVDTEDLDLAVTTAKALIKSDKIGAGLYFQVTK